MPEFPDIRRRTVLKGLTATGIASVVGGTALAQEDGDDETDGQEEDEEAETQEEAPQIIGHRGFAGIAPENTVGAMEVASRGGTSNQAANRRADMVEIDVVPCGGRPHEDEEFEVVAFHDDALAGRDGGEEGLVTNVDELDAAAEDLVWETPCETVQQAEILGTDETIPTMREIFDALPPNVGVNIELKSPGSTDLRFAQNLEGEELEAQMDIWRPFVEEVFAIAAEYQNDVLASSFYEAALATTREAAPDVPIAFLFWDDIQTGLDITEEYDAEVLHPPFNMINQAPFFSDEVFDFDNVPDPEEDGEDGEDGEGGEAEGGFEDIDLVQEAHDAGREINVWTVRSWYEAEELAAAGVDGLIADFPNLLQFGARREEPAETETPGTETPGTETPGTETPGTETPGTETPGTETPGTETPGTETPGTETPGTETPGTETPGTDTPGT